MTEEAEEDSPSEETTTQAEEPPEPKTFVVARVLDGDTIRLRDGRRVRLVQIDAPELRENECYARKSAAALRSLLRGAEVTLEADRRLDAVDQYGRLLRYVHKGGTNVNLALVKRGAASVWFFEGDRGKYARRMLAAARQARRAKKGLWRACSATALRPFEAVTSKAPLSGKVMRWDRSPQVEHVDSRSARRHRLRLRLAQIGPSMRRNGAS